MRGSRRWAAVMAAGLLAAAGCSRGEQGVLVASGNTSAALEPATTTAPVASEPPGITAAGSAGHWVPTALPEGFAPTLIQEAHGRWTMFFARPTDPGDLFDASLRVVGTSTDEYGLSQRPDVRRVQVAGRDLAVVPTKPAPQLGLARVTIQVTP